MKQIGKYDIIRLLGKGSCSLVYLAYDSAAQRTVALKCFTPEQANPNNQPQAHRRLLLTEASLAGKLIHPNIVQIYDANIGEEEGYIAMEYLMGGTLEAYCTKGNLLPIELLIEMMFKCTRGLNYAFQHGITHRDIKPANILLVGGDSSEVKISDFGAAIFHNDPEHTAVARVGSPAYMSPEQARDEPLTHQTDIYSLGASMYQLLTGELPFDAETQIKLAYKIVRDTLLPPSHIRPDIHPELDRIVMRAMQKKPLNRYPTWQDFSQDIIRLSRQLRTQKTSSL